jgi:mono/diheme cytochrome c family protein
VHRLSILLPALLLACGGRAPETSAGPAEVFDPTPELALAEARCLNCHRAPGAAGRAGPGLDGLAGRVAAGWLESFLTTHHAADPGQAADLAQFLRARTGETPLARAAVSPAESERGARLFAESGCAACHEAGSAVLAGLAQKTDLASLGAFLKSPAATRPDLPPHDFGLEPGEARALAAWLLRAQQVDAAAAPPTPGLAVECFELPIEGPGLPDLEGRTPTARGHAERIDVGPRTRDDQFALRFGGSLRIPTAGAWTFVLGSDDSSWLWLDGELRIRNEALAPHRRREVRLELEAGWHELQVVYTEASGQESLELLWEGPGVGRGPVPTEALAARIETLVPPGGGPAPDPERAARGERAFAAQRCGACHAGTGLPDPADAPAWAQVQAAGRDCPTPSVPALGRPLPAAAAAPEDRPPADALRHALQRDGCLSCHSRDGAGGMPAAARDLLVEVEDLGDEGRVPPDLSRVGHRLRAAWIEGVLNGEKRARPYMRARMPRLEASAAARYAAWFAAVDAVPGDDTEPAFDEAAAAEGQRIAGNQGFACIACHQVAGQRSIGPQGMDLAVQHERAKPGWFREWLLRPAVHRPGTRMPSFWPAADAAAERQVDAVRVWLSLGNAMPLPAGLGGTGSEYLLEADGERPRLHGAFLKGLSARCIAVGTPERTHYAYDLEHARLAWLWRGAFLDARGTWDGRAGQLLTPLGTDWVSLPEASPFSLAAGAAVEPRLAGWKLDADGYPIWRIALGAVEVEDHPRPRWTSRGSEMVRTVRVRGGAVRIALPGPGGPVEALVGGEPRSEVVVEDGGSCEVVYRW